MLTMLSQLRAFLTKGGPWPIVVLILGGLAGFTCIAIFAPPEVRTTLFGAHGLFMALVALLIGSPLDGAPPAPPTP